MLHDMGQSLAMSRSYESARWWPEVYRKAFPSMKAYISVRDDGWAQRAGIDRYVVLESGRIIPIDEKVREKDYGDILLERWSNEERKIPGWVQKALACEFIAYAVIPTAKCWLLPTLSLQRAWRLYGRYWIDNYPEIRAQNSNGNGGAWTTISVGVPPDVLFHAITDAMLVEWGEA